MTKYRSPNASKITAFALTALLCATLSACKAAAPFSSWEMAEAAPPLDRPTPAQTPQRPSQPRADDYGTRATATERLWRGAGPFVMGGAYGRVFGAEPTPRTAPGSQVP